MIVYSEFAPAPYLSQYVECFWKLNSHADHFKKRELIIPGGRIEMIFNFGDAVQWIDSQSNAAMKSNPGAHLLGPRNRPFFVEHAGLVSIFGIRFRHGALATCTSMPMTLLMNNLISADDVFGQASNTLADNLADLKDDGEIIRLIEDFLSHRIQQDSEIRAILKLVSSVKDTAATCFNVDQLCETTGLHYKKLERVFARYTGYSPKNFSRVVRFYKAARQIKKGSRALTGIGLNHGYYDQPHFIRDFKAFTGKCPTQFSIENPTIANLLLQSKHV